MLDRLEDIELNAIADARKGERRIRVKLDEL
jgi:antitoxin StbD